MAIGSNPTWQLGRGLSSLQLIQGNLQINSSAGLTALDQLSALATVQGFVQINSNASLLTVNGMTGLTTVQGFVQINSNPSLQGANGFTALTTLTGSIDIEANAKLRSVTVNNLQTVNGPLTFSTNGGGDGFGLTFDFGALTIIHGGLAIGANPTWQLGEGLSSLQQVQGNLQINSNAGLTHLDQLTTLATVQGFLQINSNPSLLTADGFTGLTALAGSIDIEANAKLRSVTLSALPAINSSLTFATNGGAEGLPLTFDLGSVTIIHGGLFLGSNRRGSSARG